MKRLKRIAFVLLLCCLTLTSRPVSAQGCYTKSGTCVTPASDHSPKSSVVHPYNSNLQSFIPYLPETYLVVTRPDLLQTLQPFLQWKRQQGYHVEVMCPSTHKRDTIRNMLLQRYRQSSSLHPPQRYVLLIGDVDRIQSFIGRHTPSQLANSPTDLYYGEYTGDYLPEAMVGRLSVSDADELHTVVNKLLEYAKGNSPAQHLLLVAGRESNSPAPTTTNGQVNYLQALAHDYRPALSTATFLNSDTEHTAAIINALRIPNALVSYTGHGLRNGWSQPVITAQTLDTLEAVAPAIFVNNCCLTNAYDGFCFGEQLLRCPGGGAVGVVGATNETLWIEDYLFAVGAKRPAVLHPIYDSTTPGAFDPLMVGSANDGDLTLGALLWNGCRAVTQAGSRFDAYYWETYNLLGDPAMIPFLGAADTLTLALLDDLVAGETTTLTVQTLPRCRVSATDDTSLLGTAIADDNGLVHLFLSRTLCGDSLTLTATRPGAKPTIVTCPVSHSSVGRLSIVEYHSTGYNLSILLRNEGQAVAAEHRLSLSADTSQSFPLPRPIAPGETAEMTISLPDSLACLPLVQCTLLLSDNNGYLYSQLPIVIESPTIGLSVALVTITHANGHPANLLLPGHSYCLHITPEGDPDSVVLVLNGIRQEAVPSNGHWAFPFTISAEDLRLQVDITLHRNCLSTSAQWWFQCYHSTETFESGTTIEYPWQNNGAYPWTIDSIQPFQGRYCLRSANIGDNEQSVFGIDLDVLNDDSISFHYCVSSEAADWLLFFIDGRRCGFWSGNSGWQRYAYPIAAGRHRLTWTYVKDASVNERDDCAHLDNIVLPLCRWDAPYGTPCADSTLLNAETPRFQLPISPSQFYIYPNPASDEVTVNYPGIASVTVMDAQGREVGHFTVNGHTRYTMRHLPTGVYWFLLFADNMPPQPLKIIIQ